MKLYDFSGIDYSIARYSSMTKNAKKLRRYLPQWLVESIVNGATMSILAAFGGVCWILMYPGGSLSFFITTLAVTAVFIAAAALSLWASRGIVEPLEEFARRNHLRYNVEKQYPPFGSLGHQLLQDYAPMHCLGNDAEGSIFSIATYENAGEITYQGEKKYLVLSFNLGRDVPDMVIDSKRTSKLQVMSNIVPTVWATTRKFELEGDFNKYFTVYCEKHLRRRVLEVLTPDVMAFCIDSLADWDIEIYKGRLYAYNPQLAGQIRDPELLEQLFLILNWIQYEFVRYGEVDVPEDRDEQK